LLNVSGTTKVARFGGIFGLGRMKATTWFGLDSAELGSVHMYGVGSTGALVQEDLISAEFAAHLLAYGLCRCCYRCRHGC
jgi:hypothetical protein